MRTRRISSRVSASGSREAASRVAVPGSIPSLVVFRVVVRAEPSASRIADASSAVSEPRAFTSAGRTSKRSFVVFLSDSESVPEPSSSASSSRYGRLVAAIPSDASSSSTSIPAATIASAARAASMTPLARIASAASSSSRRATRLAPSLARRRPAGSSSGRSVPNRVANARLARAARAEATETDETAIPSSSSSTSWAASPPLVGKHRASRSRRGTPSEYAIDFRRRSRRARRSSAVSAYLDAERSSGRVVERNDRVIFSSSRLAAWFSRAASSARSKSRTRAPSALVRTRSIISRRRCATARSANGNGAASSTRALPDAHGAAARVVVVVTSWTNSGNST